jgi:hypothetical protein
MALLTSQQIASYYELFKSVEVTFTKEVIGALGLLTKQVFLKCIGEQWPCVIYSSSLSEAKVIANMKNEFFDRIREANNVVSLRFSFRQDDKSDPLAFFVGAKITGFNPYNKANPNLTFISMTYTQRPPDDLIGTLGILLEANINSKKRKEERIVLTADTMRKMGIRDKNTTVHIEQVPRKCIIRDLSFAGAKVITQGVAKFLVDKAAVLRIDWEDTKTPTLVAGKVIRFEPVTGRKDLAALALLFDEQSIPMDYKLRINELLRKPRSVAASAVE